MSRGNVAGQLPLHDVDRSFKYLCRASCHDGIFTSHDSRLFADKTEYAGRGAGRGICSVETGRISVVKPDSFTIARANSNHEQSPALVMCTMPLTRFRHNAMIPRARSVQYVGHPRWSSTTSSAGRLAASFRIVSGKHRPPTPKSHDVRAMHTPGSTSRSRVSASAFERA